MAEQATADSPQIVISYHVDDEKWRDRLVTRLDLAAEKFGVLDHCVGPSRKIVEFDDEFMLALSRAKVLILLISRMYMVSAFNPEGGPSLVDVL